MRHLFLSYTFQILVWRTRAVSVLELIASNSSELMMQPDSDRWRGDSRPLRTSPSELLSHFFSLAAIKRPYPAR